MSDGPPAAQSATWWAWQFSAGIWQPGMMQPPSRAARALRWAGVAVRAVRPTASGIRGPSNSSAARAAIRAAGVGAVGGAAVDVDPGSGRRGGVGRGRSVLGVEQSLEGVRAAGAGVGRLQVRGWPAGGGDARWG